MMSVQIVNHALSKDSIFIDHISMPSTFAFGKTAFGETAFSGAAFNRTATSVTSAICPVKEG
jgi:hypothetical protein